MHYELIATSTTVTLNEIPTSEAGITKKMIGLTEKTTYKVYEIEYIIEISLFLCNKCLVKKLY